MKNKYVVAISGGVDSMYLATKLANKNQVAALVHINHHSRGAENQLDINIIEALANKFNLKLYVFDYIHTQGNFQANAREFRYQKLIEISKKYDKKIALAHHLDDQLENCLNPSHLVKSNLMKYRIIIDGCSIYRPLLSYRKDYIYEQAHQMNIKYNEDYTNFELKYKRNIYRNQLKDIQTMLEASKKYFVESNKLPMQIETKLSRAELTGKPQYLRYWKIYNLIKTFNSNLHIKNVQLENINKLIDSPKNSYFSIAKYAELSIGYDKIYMLAKDENIETESILKKGKNNFNGIVFEAYYENCTIRTFKHGDKVKISTGHKKISRLFIDNKVEKHLRKKWPIIVNSTEEIIEIPLLWRKNETHK